MKRELAAAAAALVLAALPSPSAKAQSVMEIRAEGSHERLADESKTRMYALDDALKKAVKAGLDTFMKPETIATYAKILESTVYADVSDYIINYRILSRGWITHLDGASPVVDPVRDGPGTEGVERYHIWIEAKIDVGRLKKDVRAMTSIKKEKSTDMEIVLLDVRDYREYERIRELIWRLDMVTDLSYRSFYPGRITVGAVVKGNVYKFKEALAEAVGPGYFLVPSSPDRVVLKAAGRAAEK
ncbi:MAG TPA: hypothetical protein ENJ37_06045 [Deltaproteobacteria bacterium]|nr:hypothetical protein [Deltaproteobacteria bacterium]